MRGTISHTRRQLLTAAPAAGLAAMMAGASPVAAVASAETPVAALFHQWAAFNAYVMAAKVPDDEFDALCDQRYGLMLAVVALPSVGAEDVLMKLLAFTDHGVDFSEDAAGTGAAILAEARAMIGGAA